MRNSILFSTGEDATEGSCRKVTADAIRSSRGAMVDNVRPPWSTNSMLVFSVHMSIDSLALEKTRDDILRLAAGGGDGQRHIR